MRGWFLLFACALAVTAAGQERAGLRELLGAGASSEEPLPPERAFVTRADALGPDSIGITFTPAPTYYLYRSKFAFSVLQPSELQIADVQLPKGETKDDPIFGRTEVYHQPVQALLTLKPMAGAAAKEVALSVTLQGCTERGLCYPPDTRQLRVQLAAAAAPPAGDAAAAQPSRETSAPKLPLWAIAVLLFAPVAALALWYVQRYRKRDIQ